MKTLLSTALSILVLGLGTIHAQNEGSLPFPVSVGGQAATYKKGEAFANLAKPVKNDAPIEVTSKAEMIIINVHKSDEKGNPVGDSPAIIILQGTNKSTLANTMDKQKLAPGNYVLSVASASEGTANILFKIE